MTSTHHRSTLRRGRSAAAAGLAGLGLLAALTACGTSTAEEAPASDATTDGPSVVVSDAWVRATVGTEDPSMTGAFMAIDNEGADDVSLTGASSPVAGMVELHEMAMVDGAMTMTKIEGGIEIRAGYGQVLMPGGSHVMLMGLSEELAPGDEVELVLEFSDGTSEELTVPVKEFTEEEGHYHESDAPHEHESGSHDGMDGMDDGMDGSPSPARSDSADE
jgi:copper(I)-binding protein